MAGRSTGERASTVAESGVAEPEATLEYLCTRRLDHAAFPRLYVDATYVKRREGGVPVFDAVVAVTGAQADGTVEVVGVDVGDSEDEPFWHRVCETLRVRGLHGVAEVVSGEDHAGLAAALYDVFPSARVVVSHDYPVIDLRAAIAVGDTTLPAGRPPGPEPVRLPRSRARRPNDRRDDVDGRGRPRVPETSAPGV